MARAQPPPQLGTGEDGKIQHTRYIAGRRDIGAETQHSSRVVEETLDPR